MNTKCMSASVSKNSDKSEKVTMKGAFSKDTLDNLLSGSGYITNEHWQTCCFLWKGSPSTEPIDFGITTIMED